MGIRCNEMILLKGEIKTSSIKSCHYNTVTKKIDVTFNNGGTFNYAWDNVVKVYNPDRLLPGSVHVYKGQQLLSDISDIYVFKNQGVNYYHIYYNNGWDKEYTSSEIRIEKSCFASDDARSIFDYLKNIAQISGLKNDFGEKILPKQYEKVSFVGEETALASYLNYSKIKQNRSQIPIFPFGCNNSQYSAVTNALNNQMSVIQGPPGTGKTQTILNIIANLVISGKTVQVVSNNNSATENVQEKLDLPKYNLGFIVAKLGKTDNKREFVEVQSTDYPDFSKWYYQGDSNNLLREIQQLSAQIKVVFEKQERIAKLRNEMSEIVTEKKHFEMYVQESDVRTDTVKIRTSIGSATIMKLWLSWQDRIDTEKKIGLWEKIKVFIKYGITDFRIYKLEIARVITSLQNLYYERKSREIENEINELDKQIKAHNVTVDELSSKSMIYLKNILAQRYGKNDKRPSFTEEDFWKNPYDVLREYPITLSTTFASKSSLGSKSNEVIYDYLIMDEASQVDVATGALALSSARNAVIVGDTKQLPNVITEDEKRLAERIFDEYHVAPGYRFSNSFLKSVLAVVPNVSMVLLREHYRCHPKIINFCNQKFYGGDLVIMTLDNNEPNVITAIKTVEGNHERNHFNQRQVDVIKQEILPQLDENLSTVGIIAPYRNQVSVIKKEIPEVDVATVHKFQGKEKDTIIISTVDDEKTDFSDDPYLINVAVSRAKERLYVVVSGNDQDPNGNINDLVSYIRYNNFDVVESKIYSVFDYLYEQYTDARLGYLKGNRRISEYDSENLMNTVITEVIKENDFSVLGVVCHLPMNMLIRDPKLLDEEECKYAMNHATHIDFVVYNHISKRVVLAIEVDGYTYHHEGTKQADRDKLKSNILQKYNVSLIRFSTTGSGEREKLNAKLRELMEKTKEAG